jgi:uncharacterized protein involved in response to NO
MTIPLRSATPQTAHVHDDGPYRSFVFASLVLGIGGGFALATLLPLAQTMKWDWGLRWQGLAQAHGQLQLMGFAGLFVMGMSFRVAPRFSGRPLPYPALVRTLIPLVAASLVIRSLAEPGGDGMLRDVALIGSAVLQLAAAAAFAAIIVRMLVHPASRAQSTGWFFVLGAVAYAGGAIINMLQVIDMVRDGLPFAPMAREQAQVIVQQFGFLLLFMGGITTRAVPTFAGRPRADRAGRVSALALAAGVATVGIAGISASYVGLSPHARGVEWRIEEAGMLLVAAALASIAWLSGVFHPRANRVASASQLPYLFVRSAMTWLFVAALMLAWYAARGFVHAEGVDIYEMDAVRHALTVGVTTMMILGLGMMIVPEFAGRRLQHPHESWLVIAMLASLNVATALRVWPAIEGLNWIALTRYWPMATAGGLSGAAVIVFGLMFLQSYLEQRQPAWASPEALAARKAPGGKQG